MVLMPATGDTLLRYVARGGGAFLESQREPPVL